VYDWYELIEWGDILSIVALEKKEKTIQKPYTNIYTKKIQLRIQTLSQVPTQNIDTTKLAPITTTTQAKQLQAKAQQDHYTYLLHRQRNTPKQFQTYYHGVNHWLVHSNVISTLRVTVNRISILLEHVGACLCNENGRFVKFSQNTLKENLRYLKLKLLAY
jgi:hypothetical protein